MPVDEFTAAAAMLLALMAESSSEVGKVIPFIFM